MAEPAFFSKDWAAAVRDALDAGPAEQARADKLLHDGYDAQRTVMYRKILLEAGDLLEFFKAIYFFVECLAVIGAVPAAYPALAAS